MTKNYHYQSPTISELNLLRDPSFIYKNLGMIWDGVYSNEGEYELKRDKSFFSILERFVGYFKENSLRKIIDVGGGTGRFAIELTKRGFDSYLQDISFIALDIAERNASLEGINLKTIKEDIISKGLNGSYEGILVNRVIHNIDPLSRSKFLVRLKKGLASKGRTIISVSSDNINGLYPFSEFGIKHPIEKETSVVNIVDDNTGQVYPYLRKFYTLDLLTEELGTYFNIEKVEFFQENQGNLSSNKNLNYLVAYLKHHEE